MRHRTRGARRTPSVEVRATANGREIAFVFEAALDKMWLMRWVVFVIGVLVCGWSFGDEPKDVPSTLKWGVKIWGQD